MPPVYLIAKKDGRIIAQSRLLEPQRGPDDRYAIGPFPNHVRAVQHAAELGYTPDDVELFVGPTRIR